VLERIRRRLTLGYVGIFALILLLIGVVAVAIFARQVASQQDDLLEQTGASAELVRELADFGLVQPETRATALWDPSRGSFEAAWAPDGATCLARTRDDRAMETILQECPNRFQVGEPVDVGNGERCTVRRTDVSPGAGLLRNLSYGAPKGPTASMNEGRP